MTAPIDGTELPRLQAENKELRARCHDLTGRVAELEHELFDRGARTLEARPTPHLDTVKQQLADALAEVGRLRAIEQAARAYITCPDQPASPDPAAVHAWDQNMADRYLTLRNTVMQGDPR